MTSSPQATAEETCAPPHSAAARIFLRKALAGRDERLHPSLPPPQEMMQDAGCVRISAAGKDRLGWGLLFVLHMEEERGITAGEIFRLIKNRIFWILAVSAFAALAAALFTSLVYNRAREEFYLSFVIDLPQEAAFRYETIVFADNLEAAKLSDASFSAIDTDRMAANEDIHISRMGEEDQPPSYRVSVKGKYFSK